MTDDEVPEGFGDIRINQDTFFEILFGMCTTEEYQDPTRFMDKPKMFELYETFHAKVKEIKLISNEIFNLISK